MQVQKGVQWYGTLIHQQQNKFVPFMTCNSVISNVFVKQKIYLTPLVCKLPFSYQALNFEIKIDTLTQQIENSAPVVKVQCLSTEYVVVKHIIFL